MIRVVAVVILTGFTVFTVAETIEKPYSPGVGQDFPRSVYWGDTHLHTRNSRMLTRPTIKI